MRRIGVAQIDAAIGHLHSDADLAAIVHSTRKCMKKLRALLRMVRPGLSTGVFERENARFRDIARQLSDLRDSHVLVATLDALDGVTEGRTKLAIARPRSNSGGRTLLVPRQPRGPLRPTFWPMLPGSLKWRGLPSRSLISMAASIPHFRALPTVIARRAGGCITR
ncbi:MAG: CHAD domain-containing protein [Verrucomicrobiae bacterium]|nr:CHAD domain-containing protein [Verrucomicrobiae bacterium]